MWSDPVNDAVMMMMMRRRRTAWVVFLLHQLVSNSGSLLIPRPSSALPQLQTGEFSSSADLVSFLTVKMGQWKEIGSLKVIDAFPILHRELRFPGPDRGAEVGPEEHPWVWRRPWKSHDIWAELRYGSRTCHRVGLWDQLHRSAPSSGGRKTCWWGIQRKCDC